MTTISTALSLMMILGMVTFYQTELKVKDPVLGYISQPDRYLMTDCIVTISNADDFNGCEFDTADIKK